MKQVNFNHEGGFPLEQETLERLQTAYRSELYGALKSHLSIDNNNDYIIAHAINQTQGWAVIRQEDPGNPKNQEGILYPIKIGTRTSYLKTIRTDTNLTYGTGASETAYYDYEAEYCPAKLNDGVVVSESGKVQMVRYYDINNFVTVTDIKTIDKILAETKSKIESIESNIDVIEGDVTKIKKDINDIYDDYLPLKGSKAMEGDLNLGSYMLSKLDIKESTTANVRVTDFRLGSALGRAIVNNATNLSLNYGSDWQNTSIGGKVYLNDLNTTTSNGSLLVLDSQNQVNKNNTLIDSLINRITKLEQQPTTAVPIGMIAIWGKAAPFPAGWEEYVPLRGRMPVGLNPDDPDFSRIKDFGGSKSKNLLINEMPSHSHAIRSDKNENNENGSFAIGGGTINDRTSYTESTGNGDPFSILNPFRVVYFIEYTGSPSDQTKPTSPTSLISSNPTNTSVTLSWTAATDNVAVTNYLVYGNNILLAQLANVLSSNITGLTPNTYYTFYVVAKDAAGNVSAASNTVNETTTATDEVAPTKPENLTSYLKTADQITIEWSASTDNIGVVEYEIWRRRSGEVSALLVRTGETNCTIYGAPNITYYFKVRAVDAAGNKSQFSSEIWETTTTPSCFDVESLVTMASGQFKKLKNIVIGDKLQGLTFPNEIDESEGDYMLWNGKLDQASKAEVTVVNKRTSIQPNYYEIKTGDATIKVTGEHPLLITEDGQNVQYVCTKNISESMLLIDKTGKTKVIESILFKDEPLEVALLDVEDVDNYVISGIVVHNSKPVDPV